MRHSLSLRGLGVAALALALSFPAASSAGNDTPPRPEVDPVRGELILFVSERTNPVGKSFLDQQVEWIEELAAEQKIPLQVRPVAEGAPADVKLTPLIVFQNHRGRSIYQGRFTTRARLENFIETARWVPQGDTKLRREDALVRSAGRTRTAGVLKITAPTGPGAESLDASEIETRASAAIAKATSEFERTASVELDRADRSFYLDFHPFVSEDGNWFVSTFIFSQFNCDIPIFTSGENPSRGADLESAFANAARLVEARVLAAIASPENGDGFVPVDSNTPVVTWEEAKLELPDPPEAGSVDTSGIELAKSWTLEKSGDAGADSRLVFAFPAPLDSYSGEARTFSSTLNFDDALSLGSVRGGVTVEKKSITMGDEHLDDSLLDSDMLAAKANPRASFEIASVSAEDRSLEFGTLVPVTLTGKFRMKGMEIPLSTTASFEPVVTPAGEPRLQAEGSFRIRLKVPFDILGPDGPSPANDTLVFHYRFVYAPVSD